MLLQDHSLCLDPGEGDRGGKRSEEEAVTRSVCSPSRRCPGYYICAQGRTTQ